MTTIGLYNKLGAIKQKSEINQYELEAMTGGITNAKNAEPSGKDFITVLKDEINKVDQLQKTADQAATNLATGKSQQLHETMLSLTQAELSFKYMVQLRNKGLEAYNEIMRMPI